MTKILLIGYNPPQLMGNQKIEAAHYRTWQFLAPLIEDGHRVHLCAGAAGERIEHPDIPGPWIAQVSYQAIPFGTRRWIKQLQDAHDDFQPDCVVAVNFSHCLYASRLRTSKPIWMDIYGDILTIMQAACFRARSDRGMSTTIGYMRQALQAGDVFSGCGSPQQHMLAGELAMAGRLNRSTFGYEFVRTIWPGSPPDPNSNGESHHSHSVAAQDVDNQRVRSKANIGDDDFVVLWCGGYNTWTDVDTLFEALEWAMSRNPSIRYVSVGANSYHAPDNVYARLQAQIEQSPHRQRYSLLGWQPWTEIPAYYCVSHVGLNIDALHYETIYGTRTRLVEMIAAGLPVITSLGPELSYLLERNGAARTFEVGDALGLGNQILELAQNIELQDQLARAASSCAGGPLSFYQTTEPLRQWVTNPRPAPDKTEPSLRTRLRRLEFEGRAAMRQIIWRTTGVDS